MLFRIVLVLSALMAMYALYEIIAIRHHHTIIHTPAADFMVMNKETGKIPVIQFMDLDDPNNKNAALLLMEYAGTHPDVLYMLRPVFDTPDKGQVVMALFAAGLQGKYWETVRLISQYHGPLDEAFFKENAALADLDLEKLKKDVPEQDVQRILHRNALAVTKSGLKSTQALMVGDTLYYLAAPLTQDDLDRMVNQERNNR